MPTTTIPGLIPMRQAYLGLNLTRATFRSLAAHCGAKIETIRAPNAKTSRHYIRPADLDRVREFIAKP